MSNASDKICVKRLQGNVRKNTMSAIEYAHHVGRIKASLFMNWLNQSKTIPNPLVRNPPPLMCEVKLSAKKRKGKMHQSAYMPNWSFHLSRVVRLMPKKRRRIRLIMAKAMPESTTSKKKSIRKKKTLPPTVVSVSIMKYRKKIG